MPDDLVVLRSGSAGSGPALKAAHAGWKVALLEPLPLGGTCAL